jgi:hypothetical protein
MILMLTDLVGVHPTNIDGAELRCILGFAPPLSEIIRLLREGHVVFHGHRKGHARSEKPSLSRHNRESSDPKEKKIKYLRPNQCF